MERFSASEPIQDTDEPSSDRLIPEGRSHMRRPSFYFGPARPARGDFFSRFAVSFLYSESGIG